MQDGEDVVKQVLHAQAKAVQVSLRPVRQVGTALCPATHAGFYSGSSRSQAGKHIAHHALSSGKDDRGLGET